MPAFEQAMRRLDAPSTPSERVACYEVLTAAADRDPDDSWSPVLAG